ncbi:flavo, HI0933 family protein, partial [Vibrio parahaemolyticus V-223/04]
AKTGRDAIWLQSG